MSFYQKTGPRRSEAYQVPASTVVTAGAVLDFDGNGNVIPCTASSTHVVMVALGSKKSTDSDYASATQMTGEMVSELAEFECDNVTGTATAGMVGKSYDLGNSQVLDVATQVDKVFTITKFISATKVWGRFNASYLNKGGFGG